MKWFLTIFSSLTLVTGVAAAAEPEAGHAHAKSMSFGFEVADNSGDFGLGLQITTPRWGIMAVRAAGGVAFFDSGIDDTGEPINYSPYSAGRLGIDLSVSWPGSNIRSYVESGLLLILPNTDFSDNGMAGGGYGTIGFEFLHGPDTGWSYFIEGTGLGTGATADKIYGDPIYQNGFRTAVGVRCHV